MSKAKVNPKQAFGDMKPALQLMPPIAELYTCLVLQGAPGKGGAATYGAWNWRGTTILYSTYIGAIRRHLMAVMCGQDNDPKSGLPHLAHLMASAAIVLDAQASGTLVDDRPMFGTAAVELLDAKTAGSYGAKRAKVQPRPGMTVTQFERLSTTLARRTAAAYAARKQKVTEAT